MDRSEHATVTKVINFDNSKKILTSESIEITVTTPDGQPLTRKLKRPQVTIGTAETNDIVVASDDYVSRKHCKLSIEDDDLFLIDLGSTNHTIFENEMIDKILLPRQTKFKIGKTEVTVRRIEEREKLKAAKDSKMGHLIGQSEIMREIFSLIKKVAPTEATICITGESGTGKELVAKSIYDLSDRAERPFVAINCGAIPPNIIESELFGHEKGAFTGASQTQRGVFEQAHSGTLFLDEIGEMPEDLQTRLLRVLETKTVRRIGGQRDIPVDVRVVAATNQDLKKNVREGKFREDLFFRLYIIPIHIPPLRQRPEDIEVLTNHFIGLFSSKDNIITISNTAMEQLKSHDWAGNVRELKNTIQRTVILNKSGNITSANLTLTTLHSKKIADSMPLNCREKDAIIAILRKVKGNQSQASRLLGIARSTLANKINKYNIDLEII